MPSQNYDRRYSDNPHSHDQKSDRYERYRETESDRRSDAFRGDNRSRGRSHSYSPPAGRTCRNRSRSTDRYVDSYRREHDERNRRDYHDDHYRNLDRSDRTRSYNREYGDHDELYRRSQVRAADERYYDRNTKEYSHSLGHRDTSYDQRYRDRCRSLSPSNLRGENGDSNYQYLETRNGRDEKDRRSGSVYDNSIGQRISSAGERKDEYLVKNYSHQEEPRRLHPSISANCDSRSQNLFRTSSLPIAFNGVDRPSRFEKIRGSTYGGEQSSYQERPNGHVQNRVHSSLNENLNGVEQSSYLERLNGNVQARVHSSFKENLNSGEQSSYLERPNGHVQNRVHSSFNENLNSGGQSSYLERPHGHVQNRVHSSFNENLNSGGQSYLERPNVNVQGHVHSSFNENSNSGGQSSYLERPNGNVQGHVHSSFNENLNNGGQSSYLERPTGHVQNRVHSSFNENLNSGGQSSYLERSNGNVQGHVHSSLKENSNFSFQTGNRSAYDGKAASFGRNATSQRSFSTRENVDANATEAITNIIPADIMSNFIFYVYGVHFMNKAGQTIESTSVRHKLFMKGMETLLLTNLGYSQDAMDDFMRVVFFEGAVIMTARKIPGIETIQLPVDFATTGSDEVEEGICRITSVEALSAPSMLQPRNPTPIPDAMVSADFRCSNCTIAFNSQSGLLQHCKNLGHSPVFPPSENENVKSAVTEVFVAFCNIALQRALSERLARWGKDYIDSSSFTTPTDKRGQSLGVRVFRSYRCEFAIMLVQGKQRLGLTIDIRAKVIRTKSLLETFYEGRDPHVTVLTEKRKGEIRQQYINEQVICIYDKKTYSVVDVLFDQSPTTMPLEEGGISHAEYFEKKKGIQLEYPQCPPLLKVYGRKKTLIYFPAELVCGNEFDSNLRSQLPTITSFKASERHAAIEEMKRYLIAGAQKTKKLSSLLPAVGIVLGEDRVKVEVDRLPLPAVMLAGIKIPAQKARNWALSTIQAHYNVEPRNAMVLNVVLVYNTRLRRNHLNVYSKIASVVNRFSSSFRFPDRPYATIEAGDLQHHWEAIEQFFSSGSQIPHNLFLLDFNQPPSGLSDPAYPVIKQMLSKGGFLSQFVNFNSSNHGDTDKRSPMILGAVGRQILNKCGVRIWWSEIPRSVPLPVMFVGVDVFHAPRRYDPKEGRRLAKQSVAAVIVQLVRQFDGKSEPVFELYSSTERRPAGGEFDLGIHIERTVRDALCRFKVAPKSCICWRDGVGDPALVHVLNHELPALRNALDNVPFSHDRVSVPVAFVVCQKRIATKFLSLNGTAGFPPGATIKDVGSPFYETFYMHGPSPPFSTPKSVRYIVASKDEALNEIPLSDLAWALCHEYPNWAGPIKVPSVVQMAHKLAELVGSFSECGDTVDNHSYFNTLYFL